MSSDTETHADSEEVIGKRPIPEVVTFEHPFFSAVEGAFFRKHENNDEVVMVTPYGSSLVELPIEGIRNELELASDSADHHMLGIVSKSLNYVQGIKIDDEIPSELHSGKASWEITDAHRALAKARISMQLVTWLSGDENVVTDMDQLAMVAEDPNMKAKINEAFGEAAERLGMGRDQREDVVDLVDGLSEEMAYIEALRAQFGRISVVESRIEEMTKIYRSDRSVMETLTSVGRMSLIAMKGFRDIFDDLDAQTGEIMAALKNMAAQVKYIRDRRDDMHRRFWAWKEIVEKWELQPAKRSVACESLLLDTYHFLAQRFLPQNEWELLMNGQKTKTTTESIW